MNTNVKTLCRGRIWALWHVDSGRAGGRSFNLWEYIGKEYRDGMDYHRFKPYRQNNPHVSEALYTDDFIMKFVNFRPFCLSTDRSI